MYPVHQHPSNHVHSHSDMTHVNKSGGICNHTHSNIEPTLDFCKSATVNYLTKWCDEHANRLDSVISSSEQSIIELQSKLKNLNPDDWRRERVERELRDDKSAIAHFTKLKSDILLLGNAPQSEGKIKSMAAFVFKRPLTDSEWKTLWPMIQREAKYSEDYYVMYTAHDKGIEAKIINHHINDSPPEHVCGKECFTKKTFRKVDELEFKTLKEAYEKHIFTKSFSNDHDKKIIDHFLCMNLSLFANLNNAESTMERFLSNHSISYIPPSGSDALNAKIKSLQEQERQVLEQIFIKKDVATELGYVSAPYGFPLSSNPANLEKSTPNILNAYQEGNEVDLNAMDSKYMMSAEQATISGSKGISKPISTQDYIKDMSISPNNLQYRLMYIPELYNDGSSVLVFSNTMDDSHVEAENIRSVLNKELANADSLLSLLKPNLVNKIVSYFYQ